MLVSLSGLCDGLVRANVACLALRFTGVSKSKGCFSRSQVYVTGVSKSKGCLSRSQVYVTGVSKSKDCLILSQDYVS